MLMRLAFAAALLALAAVPGRGALAAVAGVGPTPEAVRLASSVIARVMANHDAQVAAMARPLADFVRQADKLPPERAQVVVDEVMIPTIEAHWGSLRESLVRSYASELSVEDLRALDAFYATPSGARFLAAEPRLTAAYLGDLNRWIREQAPEVSARIKAVWSAHGWATSPASTPTAPALPASAPPTSPAAPGPSSPSPAR